MEDIKGSVLWSSKAWQRWIDYVCEYLRMSISPPAGLLQRSWKLLYNLLLLNIVVKLQCKEPSNQTYMETLLYFRLFLCPIVSLPKFLSNTCLGDMIMSCLIKIFIFFFSLLIYVFPKKTISYVVYGEATMVLRKCLLHLWCKMNPFLNPKRFHFLRFFDIIV